ncbi:hypothetical protein MYCTH_2305582 [Thermothelomyces thermophilus ATCC 42464]|uniref:Zn(2)-C6 fungal-type domain-containing protein n=1 Tax=Thermothelomyces thermophilus (strain ATCC 42464 / BCRC 31852 / DSM 1799) TaxID=573729 RepID=G2QDF8_THET4|nr:uncharacterized protein MYCTH_2305582 [Thermothelomyces thermophilus ATCC 42464]AEO58323.1 hypothetical protein MYCTH_2305582 [Thermothelomyces thermophilus ATCC 42464]
MPAGAADTEPTRRRLRRGTSSCHECRRRKVRCDFDPGSAGSCTPCRRRRLECVPQLKQAFDYDVSTTSRYRKVRQRLVRLEALVDQLLKQVQQPAAAASFSARAKNGPNAEALTKVPRGSRVSPARAAARQRTISNGDSGCTSTAQLVAPAHAQQTAINTRNTTTTANITKSSVAASLDALTQFLRSLFPPQEVVVLIVARGDPPGSPLRKYRQVNGFLMDDAAANTTFTTTATATATTTTNNNTNNNSHNSHNYDQEQGQYDVILSPKAAAAAAHPLILARKLVELAICLQQLAHDDSNGPAHAAAAARFVDAASRHVTSSVNDRLLSCIDGIELLMLEGVYHVNRGDWRHGWQTFRRALSIASALGLGRASHNNESGNGRSNGGSVLSNKAEVERVWFRLVYSDRYMSLIRGVPHAVTDDSSLGAMDGTDLRRLERVHAVVTGRIASRNEQLRLAGFWGGGVPDKQQADQAYRETLNIDDDMKQAAYLVSPETWRLPVPAVNPTQPPLPPTPAEIKQTTARLFIQLKHFHLLVLLHFPYFMHSLDCRQLSSPSSSSSWARGNRSYSISAAVHAGREVLSRFLIYRALRQVPLFYRGFDLMAVTAAVVLLLAHLGGGGGGDALEHQRPGHLQMVSQAAACFESMDARGTDPASRSAARLLRALAAAERDVATARKTGPGRQGESLLWREDGPVGGDVTCGVIEEPGGRRFTVPHFGVIHVVRWQGAMAASQIIMPQVKHHDSWGTRTTEQQWPQQEGQQEGQFGLAGTEPIFDLPRA